MSELDLTAIKKRIEAASAGPWDAADDGLVWAPRLGDPVSGSTEMEDAAFIAAARQDVPMLVAEVERQRRLLGEPFPSSDAYEDVVQALTDERAEVVRLCDLLLERSKEREELRALLAEILGHFLPAAPSTAGYALRSEPVPPETLDRWRSRLGGVS